MVIDNKIMKKTIAPGKEHLIFGIAPDWDKHKIEEAEASREQEQILKTQKQLLKEQKRFVSKFGSLSTEKARVAKAQNINKEILTGTLDYKI